MDDQRRDQNEDQHDREEIVEESVEQDPVQQELEQMKNLATQFENSYKRALADYQNLQRRTQGEKAEWIKMATRDFILKLLPVLDTLLLATKHIQDKGLDLSVDQFLKVLQDEGVTKIETVGKEFDPNLMEVVTTREADKKEAGKVVEEVRGGFMFNEVVIRPSQVIIGA